MGRIWHAVWYANGTTRVNTLASEARKVTPVAPLEALNASRPFPITALVIDGAPSDST